MLVKQTCSLSTAERSSEGAPGLPTLIMLICRILCLASTNRGQAQSLRAQDSVLTAQPAYHRQGAAQSLCSKIFGNLVLQEPFQALCMWVSHNLILSDDINEVSLNLDLQNATTGHIHCLSAYTALGRW